MARLLPLLRAFTHLFGRLPKFGRFGLGALLGLGITLLMLVTRVSAAETVILQYLDAKTPIPFAELNAFATDRTVSPTLNTFLQATQQDPDQLHLWLTSEISARIGATLPTEFALLQMNKTVGDPVERRADLTSLKTAFDRAYKNNQAFSFIEVLENYPQPNVRLQVDRLGQSYTDINLFVTRLSPVLKIVKDVLPELICTCALQPAPASTSDLNRAPSVSANAMQLYQQSQESLKPLFAIANQPLTDSIPSEGLLLASANRSIPDYENTQLVFSLGPFQASFSIGALTRFVETGTISPGWRNYLKLAKINPDDLRNALSKEVKVDVAFIDKALNSLVGEYLLYQVGQIIHTPSRRANIQALRSAIVLAAADDGRFSTLELLQKFPTQRIMVNGARLARVGKNLGRISGTGDMDMEGWLVQVQASVAEQVCNCEKVRLPEGAKVFLRTPLPAIAPDEVKRYLPLDWTPVPSHREDRGIIKVVWLEGTPYEMGYQHGKLLHDEIASIGKPALSIARLAGKGLAFGRLARKRSYPDVVQECKGMAAAAEDIGITEDVCMMMAYADVFQEVLGYTLPKELFWDGCNQIVAANQATVDGRLYHGTSVDNDDKPVDYVINNPVIFVRQPKNGLPHVFVTYPGVVWPNSGMNVAGISLGLDTAHPRTSNELSLYGRSNVQIMAQILATATSFDQAQTLMQNQPRVRANLIMITDGKSRQAGVFEFTGRSLGVRSLQDNGVLYTANHFVLPEMYEKQAFPLSKSSISRFERFKQLMEPDGSSTYYGQIDPAVIAKIERDRINPYTGQASPPSVFDDNASPGGNGSLRQVLYDPAGLRLWVAAGQPPVPENPFVCFSMGDLLGLPNATPCETPSL